MFRKLILILVLIGVLTIPAFGVTGTYSPNDLFYKPSYGEYGVDAFNEYETYIDIADAAIKANKDAFDDFAVSDITDVDLTDIANLKILKYNSTTEKWECEDDSSGGDVDTSGTPVQYDIARFIDADTIEGRSYAELKADLDLEIGTDVEAHDDGLLSIAGLTTAANKSIYTTALDTYAVYDLTAFARTILDDADASAVRTTIDALQDVANAIDSDHYTDASIDHEHLAPDVISGMTDVTSADADYILIWDATDSALKKVDMGEVRGTGGFTTFSQFDEETAWRIFYSNADGDVTELALGADGTYLESNGAAAAPTFTTPAGAGDVTKVGTPVDSQVGVWTGDGTIEGAASLTYDGSNLQLTGDVGSTGTRITKGWFANLETTGDLTVNGTALASTYEPILTDEASLYSTLSDVSLFLEDTIDDTSPELGGEMDAGAHTIGFTLQSTTGDGTTTINWTLGNKFKFTFGAQNDTFTFTAPTNPCTLMLTLIQDGTGSRTITWPATVKWPGGTAPTLTTTANARDKVALDWDGAQYDGVCSKDFK